MPDQEGVHSNGAPNLPATTESAQGTKNAPRQEPERAAESSDEGGPLVTQEASDDEVEGVRGV
jgi:hypothetical protein